MNNCQKHKNHHCVHSHQCNDMEHKKKNCRKNSKSKSSNYLNKNKKYQSNLPIILDNHQQQCTFRYQSHPIIQPSPLQIQSLEKSITSLTFKLKQSISTCSSLQQSNQTLTDQNIHLQSQLQYLRQQLSLLISNHNIDIQFELKKHLLEIQQLNLKIKQFITKLYDQQKEIEIKSTENYQLKRKNNQYEKQIKKVIDKNQLLYKQNNHLILEKNNLITKNKQYLKQLQSLKNKYTLLTQSINTSTKSSQTQLTKLTSTNQHLQKSLHKIQNQLKKQKQLYNIQKNTYQKLIQQFKLNINQKDQQLKSSKQKNKQLQEKEQDLIDDLKHAKQIILKYQNITQFNEKCKNQLKQTITKNQTKKTLTHNYSAQKSSSFPHSHPFHDQTILHQQIKLLQQQNTLLKQKLTQISPQPFIQSNQTLTNKTTQYINQPQKIVITEQFILSIGASLEYKKILQQKNNQIKQLLKQKNILYNQIYQKQLNKY